LSREITFAYLGVPLKQRRHIYLEGLILCNTHKALATMSLLSYIDVIPSGFSTLLSTRFYAHIVRPQLEYNLDIYCFTISQLHALEEAQDTCIRRIYGTRGKTSTKVTPHLSRLLSMSEWVSILQTQFLFLYLHLFQDTLLNRLQSYIR
jgi:hypothetical protein